METWGVELPIHGIEALRGQRNDEDRGRGDGRRSPGRDTGNGKVRLSEDDSAIDFNDVSAGAVDAPAT
jgi:hypothetical protein